MSDSLSVRAAFDRRLAFEGGGSIRYLGLELVAPVVASGAGEESPPLNLAIVVDASGSMSGGKLESAKRASCHVIEALRPRDTLSVVSFADDVIVHVDGAPMDASGTSSAADAIRHLQTRGSTFLSGGYLKGAECAATVMEARQGTQNRVLLLSDGHANAGICAPEALAVHARELANRGLLTSAVGIGDGYDERLLGSLAESGGGRVHDAEFDHEIDEVLLHELGELRLMAAERISVTLRHPSNVKVEQVGSFPNACSDTVAVTDAGSMVSGARRLLLFRLHCPAGKAGGRLEFEVHASWHRPGDEEQREAEPVAVALEFAGEAANASQPQDQELSQRVAELWQNQIVRTVTSMNRDGAHRDAGAHLRNELPDFKRYCERLPDTARLVSELEFMLGRIDEDWGERSRKELNYRVFKAAYGVRDSRSNERDVSAPALMSKHGHDRTEQRRHGRYRLTLIDGHPVAEFGQDSPVRALIDTGSPQSFGAAIALPGGSEQLPPSFLGLDAAALSNLAGFAVDALLGCDLLSRYSFTLTAAPAGGTLLLDLNDVPLRGPAHPLRLVMGVPVVTVEVDGQAKQLFLDTGAKLSYLRKGTLQGPCEVQAEDFYPGFGRFPVELRTAKVSIDGQDAAISFGELPFAIEATLLAAGAEGILGAELLSHFGLTFARGLHSVAFGRLPK